MQVVHDDYHRPLRWPLPQVPRGPVIGAEADRGLVAQAAAAPRAFAYATASAASAVLPMPASPASRTTPPAPPAAVSTAARSAPTASRLPTSMSPGTPPF